jgi:RHS repeat-associated protein
VVYNEQGFVVQTSEPYNVMEDEEPVWNTMVYDRANRLVTHTDAAGHTTRYLYNERTTSVADALGGYSSRTVDASGNLSYCIDQAGDSVVYSYDVDGHCTMVRGGGKTILMEYDLMGNRTLLDDPDMGQEQTQYNAYGELIRQTDDKGTTTWNYDNLGRVVQETRPDMTTTSVYDTRFIGALTSQTVSNGTGMSYQYDEYGRVTSKESVIGNRTFLTKTYYTPYNQVACIKYPSGLRIGYTYSLWGNLLQVTDYDSDDLLWELDSLNARGQVTSQIYGNTKEIHTSYDPTNGRIVGIRTNGIQDWTYAYDALGNLTERKDCSRNLTETFGYDLRNRLVRTSRNSLSTQLMTYDAAGNLLSKTGVGHDFAYEEGSNRLVSFYADSPLPRMWDDIQYNSFHKVTSIVQGSHSLALTYGPSKSRMKAVLSDHQTVAETKYYIDNLYEEIQKGAEVTQLSYIFAGDVCIAIHEHSSTNGTRLLYLHHDHLGSVQAYSDEQGHLVQELSYDAWGCRRSPDTWEPFERFTEADAANPWGFTGHEHLDLFEMVNMEGRIYDPLLGRFLSPDPYVQAPDYTQSLNRYVYCLNNPLSLTDPTGYNWLDDNWRPITAAIVGITVSAITMGAGSGLGAVIVAGAAGGAASALTNSLLNGANFTQSVRNTFSGAVWGGVSAFLNYGAGDGAFLEKLFKHTISEGWLEGVQGGNMFHGFMMGAVSGTGGHLISSNAGSLSETGMIAANAVLSGTIDELGGGNFANGAITGAYSMMFNDLMHVDKKNEEKESVGNSSEEMALGAAALILSDDFTVVGVQDDVLLLGVVAAYFVSKGLEWIESVRFSNQPMKMSSEHTSNKSRRNYDKHTAHRSGSTYNHNQNQKRGYKNQKHEHPVNPNKRK